MIYVLLCSTFNRIRKFIYVLFVDPVTPKPCAFYWYAFFYLISCAKISKSGIVLAILFGQLTSSQEKKTSKSRTFVYGFVPLAFYPIIRCVVQALSLLLHFLCGGKRTQFEFLLNLVVCVLSSHKILLVDRRQTKKINKRTHRALVIVQCVFVFVVLVLRQTKNSKRKREKKLCNSQKSVQKFLRLLTNQPTLFVLWDWCACSGCNMHILLFEKFSVVDFFPFRFYFLVYCFCTSSFWKCHSECNRENGIVEGNAQREKERKKEEDTERQRE